MMPSMFCARCRHPATFLWHESENLENCDAIVVPGGFAYGDYLEPAQSPGSPGDAVVKKFAASGGLVLGNLQRLPDSVRERMLPGALLRNAGLRYICETGSCADQRPQTARLPRRFTAGQVLKIPSGT